jgi:hypothetical protein
MTVMLKSLTIQEEIMRRPALMAILGILVFFCSVILQAQDGEWSWEEPYQVASSHDSTHYVEIAADPSGGGLYGVRSDGTVGPSITQALLQQMLGLGTLMRAMSQGTWPLDPAAWRMCARKPVSKAINFLPGQALTWTLSLLHQKT